ncbi:hypothetical protein CIG75_11615 [Tumebacillus algifaecis]|uniref:Uncharacterized protein n=1 Tax=Tumebacillus algifaecis TaxID=1214604 RepID=A0A223D1Z2_9BACL|nr:hypothetical protein [Tumebacillus algifaecis]ASS75571.1 hypothetical protein CIG75_11615 [Tumebacillus algifaecis]
MDVQSHEDLRLARALDQLSVYFYAIRVPFTVADLYRKAYGEVWEEMPGALWLEFLSEDPYVRLGRDEFYSLMTIFETLHRAGLVKLLDVIAAETERLGIDMGVMKPGHYIGRPSKHNDEQNDS